MSTSPLLYLLVYLGGVLTIVSPCILPVVPLLFAQAERRSRGDWLPLLAGLALTFTLAATAATATAGWVAGASVASRWGAMIVLAVVGASLVLPRVATVLTRPLVRLGGWLDARAGRAPRGGRAFVVGAAAGLLWAPCAGPILGLVVAAAALRGAGTHTAALFLTFALGAATSLGVGLAAGGRLLDRVRPLLRADATLRRALGLVTLAGVLVIAAGWDQALYAGATVPGGAAAEQLLVQRLAPAGPDRVRPAAIGKSLDEFVAEEAGPALRDEGEMPELTGATRWLNSPPLTRAALRGRVVVVSFWTYGCYNCLNALPHVKALEARYRDRGVVVVGVHTPEFAHEKVITNVEDQVRRLGVVYPVPVDNEYRIWNAFHNRYWPAAYFVDRRGRIRYHHFGEGRYEEQQRVVEKLLAEP